MEVYAQLLIEVAKNMIKGKTVVHKFVWFQTPKKDFRPEVFLRLKYFSEKLPLSQKLRYFRDACSKEVVFHNVLYYQQLPNARYQVLFYANK